MKASLDNPIYTVYLVDGDTKYNITPTVINIDFSDQAKQIAQAVTLTISNIKASGTTMASLIKVRQRVFINANDGTQKGEVFRGWVWTKYLEAATTGQEISVKCYDNLIYFQESEDSRYFSSGRRTDDIVQTICNDWGIKLSYSYSTIKHTKLVLRGSLSDIFTSDILNKVKEQTGNKYVVTSQKDVMYVKPVGSNTPVYNILAKKNAVSTRVEQSMDGMVTKVVILGKAEDDSDKRPVVATVTGDTSAYGTLQKLQDKKEDTSLADAKEEAQNIIKEKGKPSWVYEVRSPDIPWIRKGDKVHVEAGGMNGDFIAISVERSIGNKGKEMTLTLNKA